MASILDAAPDCEYLDGRWIIPLRRMPVVYLLDAGLVTPADILDLCAKGSHLHASRSIPLDGITDNGIDRH